MYKIVIYNFEKTYLLAELINVFLRPDQYKIYTEEELTALTDEDKAGLLEFNKSRDLDKDTIKREIYDKLSQLTGAKPKWGVLTGIRPVKLFGETYHRLGSLEAAKDYLTNYYYVSHEKIELISKMYLNQLENIGIAEKDSAGVYVGIPFCPTRCVYCSFASNQVEYEEIGKYVLALEEEIKQVGKSMKESGVCAETIYIGGGTPTTLSAEDLDMLLDTIEESIELSKVKEFTVEAGRPDTITLEKLEVLKSHGIKRISINPQTMKDHTLELIGRKHKVDEIVKAFGLARQVGFDVINADIIAGLPEEDLEDFKKTLDELMKLEPENVTVHSLTVKRASKLKDLDPDYHYKQAELVKEMVSYAMEYLGERGYEPYYLYRQKHMAGACENIGYAKKGCENIYNMRIMDEHQSIIALGAGGISKAYDYDKKTLERVPNVYNYVEYINRVDEMIDRKNKKIFGR